MVSLLMFLGLTPTVTGALTFQLLTINQRWAREVRRGQDATQDY